MILSVRARLTGLIVLVAFLLGVVAATLGVDVLEEDVVANELDAAANEQLDIVKELIEFGRWLSVLDGAEVDDEGTIMFDEDTVMFLDEFSAEVELESLSLSLTELVGTDAFAQVLNAAEYDGEETVPILTNFGQVVQFDPESLVLEGPEAFEGSDTPVISQYGIDELFFFAVDFDIDDVFAIDVELDDVVASGAGAKDLGDKEMDVSFVFDTRSVDGTEFVVFADVSDLGRGLDNIRSIVWLSVPVLVILGGVVAWLVIGRALSPVQSITSQVGEISGGRLHERVPEPGTGDEIAELAATMNAMLDRLEVDDRRLRRFVSDASHELRSPVAVLRSEAEVAARNPDGTSVTELADGMLAESIRLQRIVEDLLVLARGEERQTSARVEIDVDDLVLREAARRRSVPVDTRAVCAGRVSGSAEAVGRVITHLLDNAARHARSRVEIGLGTEGAIVELWVDDDGPGVPVEDRDRIFERFARLDDARTRDRGGAGLGLAVVAESARSMGGRVVVEDAPSGGARFMVRWPAAP